MTREAIKGLRVLSGVAVFLLILATGAALPLRAAPPPQPAGLQEPAQESQEPTLETTLTVSPTIVTTTPSPAATSTVPPETPTVFPTATAQPTDTPFSSPLGTPTPTQQLSALATPTGPPTSTPAPAHTPTSTPVPPATPTSVPPPTATPTLSPIEKIISYIPGNSFLAAAICLIPLLMLGLLLILAVLWKKRPQPEPPPPSPPPPVPTGPYLESVDTAGGSRRLYLKPDGVTVGQSPENDIVITQDIPHWETVSRRHARIYEQAGRWIVEDAGSVNGIYVNGRRTGRNLLRDGWRLGFAGVEFVFRANAGEG